MQPFRVTSSIGAARRSLHAAGHAQEVYPAQFRPAPSIPAHLTFALKHEMVHLEFLSRLFAAVMAERCGKGNDPLEAEELTDLQSATLGRATRYWLRKSSVFIGHVSGYAEIVDYVAPHWDHTGELLNGLQEFLIRTRGRERGESGSGSVQCTGILKG